MKILQCCGARYILKFLKSNFLVVKSIYIVADSRHETAAVKLLFRLSVTLGQRIILEHVYRYNFQD